MPGHLVELIPGDERAHIGGEVQRGGDLHLLHPANQFWNEAIVNPTLDVNPFHMDAKLARVGKRATQDPGDCLVQIGVIQNDRRVLPAQFHGTLDQTLARLSGQQPSGGCATGKTQIIRFFDEYRADDAALPGHDLEYLRRQPCFIQ